LRARLVFGPVMLESTVAPYCKCSYDRPVIHILRQPGSNTGRISAADHHSAPPTYTCNHIVCKNTSRFDNISRQSTYRDVGMIRNLRSATCDLNDHPDRLTTTEDTPCLLGRIADNSAYRKLHALTNMLLRKFSVLRYAVDSSDMAMCVRSFRRLTTHLPWSTKHAETEANETGGHQYGSPEDYSRIGYIRIIHRVFQQRKQGMRFRCVCLKKP
jgi:hypothetical protein